jgi:type I restriction enzyme S subunit
VKRVNLRDLCRNIQYGFTASATAVGSGPRFLRITDIRESILDWETTPYVDISENDESKYALQDGDLVIARTGAFTGWNTIITSPPRAVFASYLIRIQVKKDVNPFFIHYFLQSPAYSEHIESILGGSAQPNASAVALTDVELDLPSLNVQNQMADILRSFDNKIEANAACCRTLEEMSQTLFKSWFVDFDPVVAKSEGRKPFGMSDEIAALFPDSFEESDLGAVPKGWRVAALSEFCSTQYGYTTSAADSDIFPTKLLRITDMNKNPWIEWDDVPRCQIKPEDKARYALKKGDILVSRMADPGKAGIVESDEDAIFASYLVRLIADSEYQYFTFYFLRSAAYREYAEGAMSGTVQRNMNAQVITAAKTPLPPKELVGRFNQIVGGFRSLLTHKLHESSLLRNMRDALLPRLFSGENQYSTSKAVTIEEPTAA